MKAPKDFSQVTAPDGYVSAFPLPDAAELAQFYTELYYQTPQSSTYHTEYPPHEIAHRGVKANLLLAAIDQARPRQGNDILLEIGVGEGFVLKAAAEAGYDARGVDFSDFGLQRFNPDLADRLEVGDAFHFLERMASDRKKFDVCILQNVLEHVIDPVGLLSRMTTLLAPQGVASITVPNDFSRLQTLATDLGHIDRQFWFCPPQHLHYFNTDTLPRFMARNGYEVVDLFADFPIDLFLLHPGSNYVRDPAAGPSAHQARMRVELAAAEAGTDAHLRLGRALAGCGLGRDITVVVRRHGDMG